MRIARRDNTSVDFLRAYFDGPVVCNFNAGHLHTKAKALSLSVEQAADLGARSGEYSHLFQPGLLRQVCSHTSCSVAGDLRFRTVGVKQSGSNVMPLIGIEP